MSDEHDLTKLRRVGPKIADELRRHGFETTRDVLEADHEDLADIKGIGARTARIIVGDEPVSSGRPSKFDESAPKILEAAKGETGEASEFLNITQLAGAGGVSATTLYRWLEEHDEFRESFTRARQNAANQLVARALDENDEVDRHFVRFLLERCFQFIKTERHEVELDDRTTDSQENVTAEFVTYNKEEE